MIMQGGNLMKKKWLVIGVIGIIVLLGGALILPRFFGSQSVRNPEEEGIDYGITYFTVPPLKQVFVNGVVTPEESQAFYQDQTLGTRSDLLVENGQIVDEDTVLYSYHNEDMEKEIAQLTSEAARLETTRANMAYKQQLEIDRFYEIPEEERMQTLTEIYIDFNIAEYDSQLQLMYDSIALMEEQIDTEVLAPFKGKVVIPEAKTAEAPLLTLISENFYVSGTLNEKDLEKVEVGQAADIQVISTNFVTTGQVSFVDTTPASDTDPYSMSTMSSYPVKLSFDSLDGIINGYHVQATVNLEDEKISIPEEAVHEEDGVTYVLVNDFGTVTRRVIQVGQASEGEVVISSGLEAEDMIIISYEVELLEGDFIDEMQGVE